MDLAERLRVGIEAFASQNDQRAGGSDEETGSKQSSAHDDEEIGDHDMEIEDLFRFEEARTKIQRIWMTTEKKSKKKIANILE